MSKIPRNLWLLGRLWNNSRLGRESVTDFQNSRLREIMSHAHRNVPLYKEIWDRAGVRPEDIRTRADLSRLPLTSRKDFQGLPPEKTTARGIRTKALTVHKTTGSTGEPLIVHRTALEEFVTGVLRMRVMHACGLGRRDKVARIGTRTPEQTPWAWRIIQAFGQYRQEMLHLLDAPESLAGKLIEIGPDVITGNSAVLARLSREFLSLPTHPLKLRFVVTGAEVSTPPMRRSIRAAFQAPVYDTYASEEFDIIAWECPQTGRYHICDDNLVVEILKNGSPVPKGERGEVVGTSLHFLAMPFIRYRLGDEATAGEGFCPCGLPFSTNSAVDGRKTDYLVLPGGRELFASAVAYILHDRAPWIEQYEMVQESEDKVVLRVVSAALPAEEKVRSLKEEIQARLGSGVNVRHERVSQIEPGPGGKFRVLLSHIRSACEKQETVPE